MEKGALSFLAVQGSEIAVRVQPRASRNVVQYDGETIRISVTIVPESGKATKAVTKLLARALGVAPSHLTLVRGATARVKTYRLDR